MKLLALDLSLRGLGMVVIPSDWGGDWMQVGRKTFEHPLPKDASALDQVDRLAALSARVVQFAQAWQFDCERGDEIVVEDYAFSQGDGRAHALGELGGVVKLRVFSELAIVVQPVNMNTARKFLMGRMPRKGEVLGPRKKDQGGKAWAQEAARRAGCPEGWTEHERDAWIVGNCRAGELGWHAVTGVLTQQDSR